MSFRFPFIEFISAISLCAHILAKVFVLNPFCSHFRGELTCFVSVLFSRVQSRAE